MLTSIDVVVSHYLDHMPLRQVRFPKSKKRRIRKKWRKRRTSWARVYEPRMYEVDGRFVMDPISYQRFVAALDEEGT